MIPMVGQARVQSHLAQYLDDQMMVSDEENYAAVCRRSLQSAVRETRMPSLCICACSVERFMPSRAAGERWCKARKAGVEYDSRIKQGSNEMFRKKLVVRWIVGIASAALPAFSQSENPERNEVSVQAFGSFVKSSTNNGVEKQRHQ